MTALQTAFLWLGLVAGLLAIDVLLEAWRLRRAPGPRRRTHG